MSFRIFFVEKSGFWVSFSVEPEKHFFGRVQGTFKNCDFILDCKITLSNIKSHYYDLNNIMTMFGVPQINNILLFLCLATQYLLNPRYSNAIHGYFYFLINYV